MHEGIGLTVRICFLRCLNVVPRIFKSVDNDGKLFFKTSLCIFFGLQPLRDLRHDLQKLVMANRTFADVVAILVIAILVFLPDIGNAIFRIPFEK